MPISITKLSRPIELSRMEKPPNLLFFFLSLSPSLSLFLSLLLLPSSSALVLAAESSAPRVVDLGELSVTGEVRRPSINWIDSQKPVKESMSAVVRRELEAHEAVLLGPELQPSASESPAPHAPAPQHSVNPGSGLKIPVDRKGA